MFVRLREIREIERERAKEPQPQPRAELNIFEHTFRYYSYVHYKKLERNPHGLLFLTGRTQLYVLRFTSKIIEGQLSLDN